MKRSLWVAELHCVEHRCRTASVRGEPALGRPGQSRKKPDGLSHGPQLDVRAWDQRLQDGWADPLALLNGGSQDLLVRREPVTMITVRCGQFGSEHVRANDGKARCAAHRWTGGVARISDEAYPAPTP